MTGDDHRSTDGPAPPTYSRRAALGLGAAALAGAALGPEPVAARSLLVGGTTTDAVERLRPVIRPRDDWGADLPVTGPITPEDDVRFLLVHHTASSNDYGPDDVAGLIRGFHEFHTGPEKGWPDVAYNFLIDRYGGIWEARAGSVAGPVRGDATGGSQGFALLCSLIGNHAEAPVTPEAEASLVSLLAWLGERYAIDTGVGATVDFVSRGSNRWPAGTPVVATTIAGHRDMSQTSCPGDLAYDLLPERLPTAVTDLRLAARAATATTSVPAATLVTTSSTVPAPNPAPADGESGVAPATTEPPPGQDLPVAMPGDDTGSGTGRLDDLTVPAVVAAGGVAAAAAVRAGRRRDRSDDPATGDA